MVKPSLLILDDEVEVLNALNRVLRRDFDLFLFSEPNAALAFLAEKNVALILSDMRMPIMDGAKFLSKAAEVSPNSKRFILTGHSDLDLTVSAVNEGKINHYFTKPWDNNELVSHLHAAYIALTDDSKSKNLFEKNKQLNQQLTIANSSMVIELDNNKKVIHKLSKKQINSLKRLKKTLSRFISLYADTINFHTQEKTYHNQRIAAHARLIAQQLACDKLTVFQVYVAGLLYETGKITLNQTLLNKSYDSLTPAEVLLFDQYPDKGAKILNNISELDDVVEIIKHIKECYNGSGLPEHLSGTDIPLASRILAPIIAFDNLIIGRSVQTETSVAEAKYRIEQLAGSAYDPEVVKLYLAMLNKFPPAIEGSIEYPIDLSQVKIGYVLSQPLMNTHDAPLLTPNTILTESHLTKLNDLAHQHGVKFILFIKPRG